MTPSLTVTDTAAAPLLLERCRDLVRPALAEAVGQLHSYPAEMAAYAFGWSDAGGGPAAVRGGGKGVRQALAVLGAEAAGAPGAAAVPGAVAVELIHTFSLLHDDIMDGDALRRQRPSVWKAYGTGPAVLAGDALFALAVQTLATDRTPYATAAVGRLSAALQDLVRGQAEDLLFEERPWSGPDAVRLDQYRAMAGDKTGALLGCAAALGAELAGAPAPVVTALARAGRHAGVAFQAVDDLLGIWGDPAVTGKPVHSDLRRRKKTFPVLAALADPAAPPSVPSAPCAPTVPTVPTARCAPPASPAAAELAELLAAPGPLGDATARRAAALVEDAGGRAATVAEARRHLDAARACLDDAPLAPAAAGEIRTLLAFLADRSL